LTFYNFSFMFMGEAWEKINKYSWMWKILLQGKMASMGRIALFFKNWNFDINLTFIPPHYQCKYKKIQANISHKKFSFCMKYKIFSTQENHEKELSQKTTYWIITRKNFMPNCIMWKFRRLSWKLKSSK
jgi:hypothetical protein